MHARPLAQLNAGSVDLSGVERLAWECARRGVKHRPDLVAVVLHLSRLPPATLHEYHTRIARVIFQDTATRYGGHVFAMRNHDLVLLASARPTQAGEPTEKGRVAAHAPESLPDMVETLFSSEVLPGTPLTTLHRLNPGTSTFSSYLAACTRGGVPVAPAPQHDPVLSLQALTAILDRVPLANLLVLRTCMRLSPDGRAPLAFRLLPAFQSLRVSFAALNLDALVAQVAGDPFLFRHLSVQLDGRVMALLSDDIDEGRGLIRRVVKARLPLQLELGPDAVLSQDFGSLARQAARLKLRLDVAMTLAQASADLDLLEEARQILATFGGKLVIRQVQPHQLLVAKPRALGPALVTLVWSPRLLQDGTAGAPDMLPLDPARTVLEGVDSAPGLEWGRARGLILYEGAFLDQLQAAHRLSACNHAVGCNLRQCTDRARAAADWGHAGCYNTALLHAGCIAPADMGCAA